MRTIGRLALALGVLAATARAQAPRGPAGPSGGGGWMLLANKGVLRELKVDDDQARKLEILAQEIRAQGMEKLQEIRRLPDAERGPKLRELARVSNEDLRKGLVGILSPEQVARFDQLTLQASGLDAFAIPRVQEALKLTDDQKVQVQRIGDGLLTSTRDAVQSSADRDAATRKVAELRKAAFDRALALLTDDQRKAWSELTGAPYEIKLEPRP